MNGVKALAQAIGHSATLVHVDMSSNQLCGVWDDAEAGKHGNLAGRFMIDSVNHLAKALLANTSLTSLALHHNKISVNADAMRQLVEANKQRAKRLRYFSYN